MAGGAIELEQIAEQIRALRVEVARLEDQKSELRVLENLWIRQLSSGSIKRDAKPKKAILAMLKVGPRNRSDVVETLSHSVSSKSIDRKRVIHTVIGRMEREGHIKSKEGMLMLTV